MPTSPFDDVADVALTTDEQVLDRVRDLVEGAYRRQLWFMFLDERDCQLPILIPHDVPSRPTAFYRGRLRTFIPDLVDGIGSRSVVVVLERPGPDVIGRGDQEWFAVLDDACRVAGVRLRGPVLAHDDGFRWVAAEDFISPAR